MIGLLALAAVVSLGAKTEDEITSLPGWSGPLPSKQYSGYIEVGKTSGRKGFIHYWFIESESDPKNDPIVYWTNGGPGGSGISTGLLTEMGPWHLYADAVQPDGTVKLSYNNYSWNKVANVVYVSQPKGVGFSYCEGISPCINTDKTSAEDAYDFFINFFAAFPEYSKNDFYLTAESYGGIYIPTMMQQIMEKGGVPNFKGAAIGDGCWGNEVGLCAFNSGKAQQIQVEFFGGHAMYDQVLYGNLQTACSPWSDESVQKSECQSYLNDMNNKIGDFDVYNVYDTCPQSRITLRDLNRIMSQDTVVVNSSVSSHPHPQLGAALNDYPCSGNGPEAWLSQKSVAEALHVDPSKGGMHYQKGPMDFSGDLRPLYSKLIPQYRMLIYSGDVDGCVPYWGTEEWVRELGFSVTKDWRPWSASLTYGTAPQRAGYAIDYGVNDFKYVTIQGAGHMVPQHKPGFALEMFTKFIKNEDF